MWLRPVASLSQIPARSALRTIYLLITITLVVASHPHLVAQQVTIQAPPPAALPATLPDEPGAARYPQAELMPPIDDTSPVVIESDTQSKVGSRFILDGNVVLTFRQRTVQADHIEYDSNTSELIATGHLRLTGGPNNEIISASHGTLNLKDQTGRFYDVTGSVGMKNSGHRLVYANGNPFLFSGRMVVKKGPLDYEIYDGTLTSCQLPHPDWLISAGLITVDSDKAKAKNSVFHLINVPLLYMPYVTHPVGTGDRQSGFLIPVIGESSTKGIVLGEQIYWAINRSTDLTAGTEYFSRRGWSESATFRYRGRENDFGQLPTSAPSRDRGYYTGGQFVNQGGEDVAFSGRHDFSRSRSA